jgi:Ca2+-binding EF-hand superfamily protein
MVIHGKTLKRHTGSILEVLDKDKSGKIILSDLVSFLEYQLEGGFGFLDYKDDQSNEITDEDIVEMILA